MHNFSLIMKYISITMHKSSIVTFMTVLEQLKLKENFDARFLDFFFYQNLRIQYVSPPSVFLQSAFFWVFFKAYSFFYNSVPVFFRNCEYSIFWYGLCNEGWKKCYMVTLEIWHYVTIRKFKKKQAPRS